MDPASEATIVQLLPLLADEAVYTASLSRLARVAQLGSELASQRQQLAAGVTQMLERCSEEYTFIKKIAQSAVESDLLRTNSTAPKNRYALSRRLTSRNHALLCFLWSLLLSCSRMAGLL